MESLAQDDAVVLSTQLVRICRTFSQEDLIQVTLWRRASSTAEVDLLSLFDQFTDLEQTVMRLLAIRIPLQEISGITNIGGVRLRHMISVICEQEAWNKLNGTET
jgi:hypothetical protein